MKKIIGISLVLTTLLVACAKEEGEGGQAAIFGTITEEGRLLLNNPSIVLYTEPARDYDVYISYGENIGPDDRIQTNFDGEFEFNYLRPGNYTVWVYSKDTTDQAVSGQAPVEMAVVRQVTVEGKKDRVEVPEMMVYEKP